MGWQTGGSQQQIVTVCYSIPASSPLCKRCELWQLCSGVPPAEVDPNGCVAPPEGVAIYPPKVEVGEKLFQELLAYPLPEGAGRETSVKEGLIPAALTKGVKPHLVIDATSDNPPSPHTPTQKGEDRWELWPGIGELHSTSP